MFLTLSICALLLWPQGSQTQSQPEPPESSTWVLGKVLDHQGKPVPGAEISWSGSADPLLPGRKRRKPQLIHADRRGRFRFSVPGHSHALIGARWKMKSGHWALTPVVRVRTAMKPVFLQEGREVPEERLTPVRGLKAWRDRVAVSFQLRDDFDQAHPLELDSAGRLVIPPLPGMAELVELLSKQGQILSRHLIREGESRAGITLRPPLQVRVRVLDAQGQSPVRKAKIFRMGIRTLEPGKPLATTDRNGLASFWIARPRLLSKKHHPEILFCAIARHREIGVFGWNSRIPGANIRMEEEVLAKPPKTHELRLARTSFASGRLSGRSETGMDGIRILFRARKRLGKLRARSLPCVEAGMTRDHYAIPFAMNKGDSFSLDLIVPDAVRKTLSQVDRAWLELAPGPHVLNLETEKAGEILPALDLRDLRLLQIAVQGSNGKAVRFPKVYRLGDKGGNPQISRTWVLDRKGRWLSPIWGEPPPLLILHGREYIVLRHKGLQSGTRPGEVIALRPRLKPRPVQAYRIIDEKGQGVPSTKLFFDFDCSTSKNGLLKIQRTLLPTHTDAEGRFTLSVFPELEEIIRETTLYIWLRSGGQFKQWSFEIDLQEKMGRESVFVLDPTEAEELNRRGRLWRSRLLRAARLDR